MSSKPVPEAAGPTGSGTTTCLVLRDLKTLSVLAVLPAGRAGETRFLYASDGETRAEPDARPDQLPDAVLVTGQGRGFLVLDVAADPRDLFLDGHAVGRVAWMGDRSVLALRTGPFYRLTIEELGLVGPGDPPRCVLCGSEGPPTEALLFHACGARHHRRCASGVPLCPACDGPLTLRCAFCLDPEELFTVPPIGCASCGAAYHPDCATRTKGVCPACHHSIPVR